MGYSAAGETIRMTVMVMRTIVTLEVSEIKAVEGMFRGDKPNRGSLFSNSLTRLLSGLAVQPNTESGGQEGFGRDAIFGVAENATSEDNARVRRTITMVSRTFYICAIG